MAGQPVLTRISRGAFLQPSLFAGGLPHMIIFFREIIHVDIFAMLIGVVVVVCFVLIIGLAGIVLIIADASDHADGQMVPEGKGGSGQGETASFPWRGDISSCCHSAYAPTDVIRRVLGWHSTNYFNPAHLIWWVTPSCDPDKEATYTKLQSSQSGQLKNQLHDKSIEPFTDKSKVFEIMSKVPGSDRYIPRSWLIDNFRRDLQQGLVPDSIWPVLVKDPAASIQKGVWVVSNMQEVEQLINTTGTLAGNPRVVINQYITPPLLWYDESSSATSPRPSDAGRGKKFHMRVFSIMMIRAGVVYVWIPNFYKIMTAEQPFVAGDWDNKDIHMTGGSRTEREVWWQRDAAWHLRLPAEKINEIEQSAKAAMMAVSEQAASLIRGYVETPASYHLFGADILPDETGHCWFIEINRRPSWLSKNHDYRSVAIAALHAKYQSENIILPFFGVRPPTIEPDGVYLAGVDTSMLKGARPSLSTDKLRPYVASLKTAAAWESQPGVWSTRGDAAAANMLKELALEARRLPSKLNVLDNYQRARIPNNPPEGVAWRDSGLTRQNACFGLHADKKFKRLNCPLVMCVFPPDTPDRAHPEEHVKSWVRDSLTYTLVQPNQLSADKYIAVSFVEPGGKTLGYPPEFKKSRAIIKSVLDGSDILCDRFALFNAMQELGGSRYVPRTWVFDSNTPPPPYVPNSVVVVRGRNSVLSGEGSYLVNSAESYHDALGRYGSAGGIVQEYIHRPLTAHGKKMTLQAHLVAYVTAGVTRIYYASDVHQIMTAHQNYVQAGWENREIHISNSQSTTAWYEWPIDMDCEPLEACSAQESIDEAMAVLAKAIARVVSIYPNMVAGFHVFGVELLVESIDVWDHAQSAETPPENKMRAVILGVTNRPTFGMRSVDPRAYDQLTLRYFAWLEESVIGNHFATTFARNPIVCSAAARPKMQSNSQPVSAGVLQPYIPILSGTGCITIAPAFDTDDAITYDLKRNDDTIGKFVLSPTKPNAFGFGPVNATWWNDPSNLSNGQLECGLTLLSLAHSTYDKTPRYTRDESFTPTIREIMRPSDRRNIKAPPAKPASRAPPRTNPTQKNQPYGAARNTNARWR